MEKRGEWRRDMIPVPRELGVGGPAREEATMQAHVPMNTEDMVTHIGSAANEH